MKNYVNPANTHLAKRWQSIGKSIFSEMSQLAQDFQAVNFGQGFPDFPGPHFLLEHIADQTLRCHNQYAPSAGEMSLRQQLSNFMEKTLDLTYNPHSEITVTCGASEALFSSINALLNPGDKVVVFEPFFDIYAQAIASVDAQIVPVRLHSPHSPIGLEHGRRWAIDWQEFDSATASGFSLLILNSPNNPTGKVFTQEEIERIGAKVLKHNALMISDEVYENLVYDDIPYFSPASLNSLKSRLIRISSAAKLFGFTGLKVGWACAPQHITEAIRTVHQSTVFCISPHTQLGLSSALQEEKRMEDFLQEQRKDYLQKRNFMEKILEENGFIVPKSEGTFFLMANYENLSEENDIVFSKKLVSNYKIASIPLSPFYKSPPKISPWLRFAFCKTNDTILMLQALLAKKKTAYTG